MIMIFGIAVVLFIVGFGICIILLNPETSRLTPEQIREMRISQGWDV